MNRRVVVKCPCNVVVQALRVFKYRHTHTNLLEGHVGSEMPVTGWPCTSGKVEHLTCRQIITKLYLNLLAVFGFVTGLAFEPALYPIGKHCGYNVPA
jgi:hypothetical protein